jgi:hypothetical protein
LSSCRVGSGFHPLLKCLKRFTALLPDAAARIANDECGKAFVSSVRDPTTMRLILIRIKAAN